MTNIKIVKNLNGIEQVVIEHEDGSYTSMAKTTWDELQAQQNTQGGIN